MKSVLFMIIFALIVAPSALATKPKGKMKSSTVRRVSPRPVSLKRAQVPTNGPRVATASKPPARNPASANTANYRSPSSLGDGKALQVTGQNRNLNMSLILGGKSDKVEFGEVRENYRREVIETQY